MSDLTEQAIELVNELHTERLSYEEYMILIDALFLKRGDKIHD